MESARGGVSRPRAGGLKGPGLGGQGDVQVQVQARGCPGPGPGPGGVSQNALRQTPPAPFLQQIATAADGKHPTGTHSCY